MSTRKNPRAPGLKPGVAAKKAGNTSNTATQAPENCGPIIIRDGSIKVSFGTALYSNPAEVKFAVPLALSLSTGVKMSAWKSTLSNPASVTIWIEQWNPQTRIWQQALSLAIPLANGDIVSNWLPSWTNVLPSNSAHSTNAVDVGDRGSATTGGALTLHTREYRLGTNKLRIGKIEVVSISNVKKVVRLGTSHSAIVIGTDAHIGQIVPSELWDTFHPNTFNAGGTLTMDLSSLLVTEGVLVVNSGSQTGIPVEPGDQFS